ncbi:MAG: tRNA (N6-threonylcarbamoyladenosine(37)-N6)-methyltransferase TrmO [Promethearchaeota archaeon]|nr:MAG: tRNA (N6-threonylcarbamoyladenosine(37)-N6)-methyltransferase TrmO [Candidatus Lokiarchaeota archaeon]
MNKRFKSIKEELNKEENQQIETDNEKKQHASLKRNQDKKQFEFKEVGVIHTPYQDDAPYQPIEDDEGDFQITLYPKYTKGLNQLEKFKYIIVIYYIHKLSREKENIISPPWTGGYEVGIFASRSPIRPNPIGMSIVKIYKIEKNKIFTSGLDVFDGTPLLDIKPYIKDLDSKDDANYGWIKDLDSYEHLLLHIKGIPHDY